MSSRDSPCYIEAYKEAITLSRETTFFTINLEVQDEMPDSMFKCLIAYLKDSNDDYIRKEANSIETSYNNAINYKWDWKILALKGSTVILPFVNTFMQFCANNKITPVYVYCSYHVDFYVPENFSQKLYEHLDNFTRNYSPEFEQFYKITLNRCIVKPPKKSLKLDQELELDVNGNKFEVNDIIIIYDEFYKNLKTEKIISMTRKYIILSDSSKITPWKCAVIKKYDGSELKIKNFS